MFTQEEIQKLIVKQGRMIPGVMECKKLGKLYQKKLFALPATVVGVTKSGITFILTPVSLRHNEHNMHGRAVVTKRPGMTLEQCFPTKPKTNGKAKKKTAGAETPAKETAPATPGENGANA